MSIERFRNLLESRIRFGASKNVFRVTIPLGDKGAKQNLFKKVFVVDVEGDDALFEKNLSGYSKKGLGANCITIIDPELFQATVCKYPEATELLGIAPLKLGSRDWYVAKQFDKTMGMWNGAGEFAQELANVGSFASLENVTTTGCSEITYHFHVVKDIRLIFSLFQVKFLKLLRRYDLREEKNGDTSCIVAPEPQLDIYPFLFDKFGNLISAERATTLYENFLEMTYLSEKTFGDISSSLENGSGVPDGQMAYFRNQAITKD